MKQPTKTRLSCKWLYQYVFYSWKFHLYNTLKYVPQFIALYIKMNNKQVLAPKELLFLSFFKLSTSPKSLVKNAHFLLTSLAVQWLRLHASSAGEAGSIIGWGTKIPRATRQSQKKKKHILGPHWAIPQSPNLIQQVQSWHPVICPFTDNSK